MDMRYAVTLATVAPLQGKKEASSSMDSYPMAIMFIDYIATGGPFFSLSLKFLP
jgi:hypothetical protein